MARNPKYSKLNDSFENIQLIGNDVEITGVRPVHPRDRLKRKLKNLNRQYFWSIKEKWSAVDLSDSKNKPYITFDINLDVTDKEKREKVIMDFIEQNLPPDDRFILNMIQKLIRIKLRKVQIRRKRRNSIWNCKCR